MSRDYIEVLAGRALKEFLISRSSILVDGMTSSGMKIRISAITTAPATPPSDTGPFIAIMVGGRRIEFEDSSPLAIKSSELRVTLILRDYIEVQPDDDQPYEASNDNHLNIGDRIIGELIKVFQQDRVISTSVGNSTFPFRIIPGNGIQKNNMGGSWESPTFYAVGISEITFSLGSACEQETY